MRVEWLEVRDFRNHREISLEFGPGLTAVAGPNARGKTNLLEAVCYMCSLASPRVSSDLPLVRSGAKSGFLRGQVDTARGRFLIEVEVRSGGQNKVLVNRTPVRRKRDLRRDVRSVFSGPDDLSVVQGDPDHRRRFMDEAVRTLWPAKDGVAGAYERVLRQRNRLLKDWAGVGEPTGLSAWDAELAAQGSALTELRGRAVELLGHRATEEFRRVAGPDEGTLLVEYAPSVQGERLEEAFIDRLAERRADELVRRTTLVGPHRDELALSVQGLVARGFASHGEAWAAAICLRLALAGAVNEEFGESAILLLDDPFSGLDPERRARLAGSLAGRGQVLMAVPDVSHAPAGAVVWLAKEGGIVPG
ncbi:MAG TPA: DNA replication and repair protein RecF [Actinomycetota bacterium]|nr:DNA replication and repair protein RecF [Actinomycetota bacterium]